MAEKSEELSTTVFFEPAKTVIPEVSVGDPVIQSIFAHYFASPGALFAPLSGRAESGNKKIDSFLSTFPDGQEK